MKHKISVTEEDIKKGTPNDCKSCAISQALKRTKALAILSIAWSVYRKDKLWSY
jgi:hypothetical protein